MEKIKIMTSQRNIRYFHDNIYNILRLSDYIESKKENGFR